MLDGWKRKSLADLFAFRNGMNFTQALQGEQVKVIGVGDFKHKEVLSEFLDTPSITLNGKINQDDLLENDDLLFVRSNGNKALIGRCVLISGITEPVSFSGFTIRGRVKSDEIDHSFASKLVRSPLFKEHLHRMGGGSSISNLSQDTLSELCFSPPPLPEQRKIAAILRTWDESIERASQVIELRQAQYLGLRDRLINWSSTPGKSLQSLVESVSRPVPRPTESYRALSIRSHGKGTFIRNVADPTSVDMDTLYIAREGDLIVNITFAWEGAIALIPQEHDGCLVLHRFPTFVPISRRANARYLRHALRMPRFTYLLGLVSPGGAGRNRVLNKGDFLELKVPAPELNKQALIASALDTAEIAIAKASEYRDSLTRQKRGLMQKLLTGEWRVEAEGM